MCDTCGSLEYNSNQQAPNNGLFGGYSAAWLFDSTSTLPTPATGYLRLNNTTYSSVTNLYISKTDRKGSNLNSFLNSFNNNGVFGTIRLFKEFDETKYALYTITSVTVNTDDYTIGLTYIGSGGTFSLNDNIVVSFTPASYAPKYKVYTALLTQSGTSAPVATVLENTLGGTVVWTRTSTGSYLGTLTGAFPATKTFNLITNTGNLGKGGSYNYVDYQFYRNDDNTVSLSSYDFNNGSTPVEFITEDSILTNTPIEIRVYN